MSTVLRVNRIATDYDVIRLNSVGLSLATIASIIGCHPTTVTLRLKSLCVPPADTRRTFMEDVFKELPPLTQEWFADEMQGTLSLKQYMRKLIVEEHNRRSNTP